jgi:nucleoside-diphosphate-sugar epimerase
MNSVLVTGANGFVGRNLCSLLRRRGARVVAATRLPNQSLEGIGVRVRLLSLSDARGWQEALRSIDCVVHLAAHVHQSHRSVTDLDVFHNVNVLGSGFIAEQAAAAGVSRLLMLSSIKVNGEGNNGIPYRADDIPMPEDTYGKSKLAAEDVVRDVCLRTNIEYVIVRPPLVYGPGVKANFRRLMRAIDLGIPLPFRWIDNQRSMVGIENLLSLIETCIQHPNAARKTWLVSDGEDLSTPDLILRLAKFMKRHASLVPCPPTLLRLLATVVGRANEINRLVGSLRVDINATVAELAWHPIASVDQELERTVADYRLKAG